MNPAKPIRAEIVAAYGKTIPDVIAPGLKVLFCGINPGLYSGATGHHFARPGNRFWPVLHAAGFTAWQLSPAEERLLLAAGFGVTNLVARATATADELTPAELLAGQQRLAATVDTYQPRVVAVLGIGAYRTAFARPRATVGPQSETLASAKLWVLPNPSGLNAHYQFDDLVDVFRTLREEVT